MPYVNVCAGISFKTASDLVAQYFLDPPTVDNPIRGQTQQNVDGLGSIVLTWDFWANPQLVFGTPAQQDWNNALGPTGQTNGATGTSLPSSTMIQAEWSKFSGRYTVNDGSPVPGTADIVAYLTIDAQGGQITLNTVAILFKSNGFTNWDSNVFSTVLLPVMFDCAGRNLAPIQFPPLYYPGIAIDPKSWALCISNGHLLGAGMLGGKGAPDFSGFVPPDDPAFLLMTQDSLDRMCHRFASQLNNQSIGGPMAYQDLATSTFNGKTENAVLTSPGLTGSVDVGGNAIIDVTEKGLGYGGTSDGGFCATLRWGMGWPFGGGKPPAFAQKNDHVQQADDSTLPFTYDLTNTSVPVGVNTSIDDNGLSLTVAKCGTPGFKFILNSENANHAVGDLVKYVLDPCLEAIAAKYEPSVPSQITGQKMGVVLNKDLPVGGQHKLSATNLAVGNPPITLSNNTNTLKITCTLSLAAL